jgi:hypothetical protein
MLLIQELMWLIGVRTAGQSEHAFHQQCCRAGAAALDEVALCS